MRLDREDTGKMTSGRGISTFYKVIRAIGMIENRLLHPSCCMPVWDNHGSGPRPLQDNRVQE